MNVSLKDLTYLITKSPCQFWLVAPCCRFDLECCLFILVDPLPLVFSDFPTAILTEKFQETGGHLAVLDFGDSLAPTENTMG